MLSFRQRVKEDLIKNHIIKEPEMDEESIKKIVDDINKQIAPLDSKLKDLYRALEAIREVCPHTHDDNKGHGHNYTIYECRACGRVVHW